MRIILASGSPRRREILSKLNLRFEVIPSDVEESVVSKNPVITARYLSRLKAKSVWLKNKDALVIGADTVVYFRGEILGKPRSEEEAFRMLRSLSGNWHTVVSGVSFFSQAKKLTVHDVARVKFRELSDKEIWDYIKSGEPMDKAGAYGIQEFGATIVERIHGNFYTVMGLPVVKVYKVLKEVFKIPLSPSRTSS
ncbi:Maf family protein [Aquifex sp.]